MSQEPFDEVVVQAIVMEHFGVCPDLGTGQFRAKVTYCALGPCPERREADRRIASITKREPVASPAPAEHEADPLKDWE